MIFLYIIIAAFALVIAADEVLARLPRAKNAGHDDRTTRLRAAADLPPVGGESSGTDHAPQPRADVIRTAYSEVGAEVSDADWFFPSNVYPIHHRRSLAHPHLRLVPENDNSAA